MRRGLETAPGASIEPDNLKWELPIAAATGVLIAAVDLPAANRAKSEDVALGTDNASNIILGGEFGAAALTYAFGCANHKPGARRTGFTMLSSFAYGVGTDLLLKAAFNREYPNKWNGDGRFWAGGKSFPSGHSAAAWSIASAYAATNPRHKWTRWAAFGAAASVGMLRFPARKHFPSDILVGGTLGYVAGRWIAER